jgi:GAF domain-containing protein
MVRGVKPAKAKVEARPPVTRKSRKVAGSTGRQLEQRLAEALEQQAATSEILHAISRSPTDLDPVFRMILANATRLCGASVATLWLFDGEFLSSVAHQNASPGFAEYLARARIRPSPETTTRRAALERKTIHVADLLSDPDYSPPEFQRKEKVRTVLSVPLLRQDTLVGVVTLWRREVRPFADRQVALVETFADQAVIAIENLRLFKELGTRNRDLTEALEQQTATSDILRVISRSQTNVQPVFDTIAKAALELCRASSANVFTYDGELVHLAAFVNVDQAYIEALRTFYPRPLGRDTAILRAIQTRSVVAIADVLEDKDYVPVIGVRATAGRFRSVLAVPLMRDGHAIGGIAVGRAEPGAFPDTQVELLKTFADQAVIAIENVRLFTELEARNRDLTEALEQQTATSEILRVISQSHTDAQPVFETIAAAALKLCRASSAHVVTFDGELVHLAALANLNPGAADALRQIFPRPPSRDIGSTRAVLTGRVVAIPDALEDREYAVQAAALAAGYRSVLAVPLIREGTPIGAIGVARHEPGPFPDKQVALLQTFADQAVIAIENVRLFTELEARTTELTQSVGELRALGEVGQAVSSTLDLETVLRTIVSRATALTGMDGGSLYEYDETREEFYLHTADRLPDELVEALRATPIRKGEGALGQMAVTGEPVQIGDIIDERSYQSRVREILIRLGYRSLLAVPLLREDHLLGGLVVNRKSAGEFTPQVIDLLKTFATQSALAIQNARLFREIEEKSRQLETASRHKSEFLANMSHELRTPLNAIIGFSEVLSERMFGEINDKQAEYLSDILESGRHLLSLINDILDLSKIEAGRMELEPSEFDLPAAIENTLILVRERAQRRGITLGRTVDARLGMIRADERKLKQVLLNLLSNALKFTPEGGQIDVRARAHNGEAEISVADTGVGIAPEDQETVFEEFRQVGTAARKVEGTGLGLAISRKFIELHGGRIWVKSQVGMGSTFAFTVPLTIDQRHQAGS